LTFTLSRRLFLESAASIYPSVKSWSYLATYDFGTPILGTFHGSDLIQVFNGILPNNAAKTIRGYYFSFVYYLDPNQSNNFDEWPQWSQSQKLIEFQANRNDEINDNFRNDTYRWLKANLGSLKI
jgi:hypothetical protein